MSIINSIDILPPKFPEYLDEAVKRGKLTEALRNDEEWIKEYGVNMGTLYDRTSRSMCGMFVRLMNHYRTPKTHWFRIVLVWEEYSFNDDVEGEAFIQMPFDYFEYVSLNDYERQKVIAKMILEGARRIGPRVGWDIQPFEDAYRQIVDLDYENDYLFRSLTNPTRRYRASIRCVHDVHAMKISMVFHRRGKNETLIIEKLIADTSPDEWDFYMYKGKLKWLSPERVRLAYRGYRGYNFLFKKDQISGIIFDFSRVIEKFESETADDICEEDIGMEYLYGSQEEWT